MFSQKTVIPSIRQLKDLQSALSSKSTYIFLSEVHIGNLKELTNRCHQAGKKVIVHLDLVEGLTKDTKGVKWLKEMFKVDGVISPNQRVLNAASKMGMLTIYRIFLFDSRSLDQSLKSLKNTHFDGVEILPGPFAIHFVERIQSIVPEASLLAGGFLDTKDKINKILHGGFVAVTTSNRELW
ncbi:MAG: glycerol-3-phosphate responsive antiterminator [Bacillota bacterium]|uniref:Glycerol uptake operon antiterminator regulatory protein n=1 Tax=Virgibacillus salarius TaxID=447199 RepID=A0A941DWA7_9BACI|nr:MULTISPECIES: glycerol-3-phosphate responsive antiterminator [Bacillaceae]NAZ09012.1 glycerol-3-phosphate responsive antiterminator [Agaribacter marinus]MBR7796304.1 glycerol-3-phosphate responsive antiterminator [Virgibacillus salarius]MCC2248536.1 glycerol-3-phosphate responsive antiterminator [Virgibacillus sp. AGTR]MDY7043029.1 glycerol-3-phosphate responsive antiterminator [Virgibacillus sp. M23]QRZ16603.1 glycerol-3-phosphate responsive antiterminator [Virgibacillus sp. AGTR]